MSVDKWSLHPSVTKGLEGRAPGPHRGHALSQAQPESQETGRKGRQRPGKVGHKKEGLM